MSETPHGSDSSTDSDDSGRLGRRTFLRSAGLATVALSASGSAVACPTSTTGERYGYGTQYYGFSGFGGSPPPCEG